MFDRMLPPALDNTYRGHKLALWLLGLVVLMRLAMSVNSIFNGYSVASSADGIPLDSYPPAAARTIVALFSILGLAQLMICLLVILVLARYRSMVSFTFALLLVEHLGRRLILQLKPIARTGTPPGYFVNLVLLALMLAGLVLSFVRTGERRIEE